VIVKSNPAAESRVKDQTQRKRFLKLNGVYVLAVLIACVSFPVSFVVGGYFAKKEYASKIILPFIKSSLIVPWNFLNSLNVKADRVVVKINKDDLEKLSRSWKQKNEKESFYLLEKDVAPAVIIWNRTDAKATIRLIDAAPAGREDGWAFHVRNKNTGNGIKMLSYTLQPLIPQDFMNGWFFHAILGAAFGIQCPKSCLVSLTINSTPMGTYVAREAPLFSPESKGLTKASRRIVTMYDQMAELGRCSSFSNGETTKEEYAAQETKMLLCFRERRALPGTVFELTKLSKMFALLDLFGYKYSAAFSHIQFVCNHFTRLLEPIGYDWSFPLKLKPLVNTSKLMKSISAERPEIVPLKEYDAWYTAFFGDTAFSTEYVRAIDTVSRPEHLDSLIKSFRNEYTRQMKIIHKTEPGYSFNGLGLLFKNQKYLHNQLHPHQTLQAFFKAWDSTSNVLTLQIGNILDLPARILFVQFNSMKSEQLKPNGFIAPKPPYSFIDFKDFQFKMPRKISWKIECVDSMRVFYSLYGSSHFESESIFPWTFLDERMPNLKCSNY
jgi:hypothetical protein